MPLAVMGRSLLENFGGGRELLLTIIDGGMSVRGRERVERSWAGAAKGAVQWEWVEPRYGKPGTLPAYGRVPKLTYARLFLNEYCAGAERTVLLDSDTLVLADIGELQDMDLEGCVIGACTDPFIPRVDSADGLPPSVHAGLPSAAPYFNAGVMVADLALWRQERIGEQSLGYIARHSGQLRQQDQDPLNAVLAGRWKRLPAEWNTQPRTPHALGIPLPEQPRIVHFSGRLKPWLYDGGTELDRLFFCYADRTEWRGSSPPRTWRARAWKAYDSPLRRVLHTVETRALSTLRRLRARPQG